MDFKILEEPPTPAEYCEMRAKCGLMPRTESAARVSLPKSLYAVTIRNDENRLIAMGRVVGDLGSHVQIVDIAVDPDFQKQGYSTRVMKKIMNFIDTQVPDCAFVNLFADVDYLYQKYGFQYPVSKGMFLNRAAK